MRKLFCLILIGLSLQACMRPLSETQILARSRQAVGELKAFQYEAAYKTSSPGEDTIAVTGKVQLLKDDVVRPLGYKTTITYAENAGMGPDALYFNGDTIFTISNSLRKIWVSEVAKVGPFALTGNLNSHVIGTYFTAADPFPEKFMEGKMTCRKAGEATILNQKCWTLKCEGEDPTQNASLKQTIYLSKKTFLPVKVSEEFRYQDQLRYSDWEVWNLEQVKVGPAADFPVRSVPKGYEWELVKPRTVADFKLLPAGQPAPAFELPSLLNQNQKLSDLKGKVVLLDFWYQSCAPCLKAIPHLQALYEKYQDQGLVVLGLNSKDNEEKRIAGLKEFAGNRKLTYPILLSTAEFDNSYLVKAYPTLYLIDTEGNIAFSQLGFSDEMAPTLESEILKLLPLKKSVK